MNSESKAIFDAALSLPAEGRSLLVNKLLESLEQENDSQIDEMWAAEAEQRLNAFEDEKLKSVPAETIFRSPPSAKQ